MKVYRSSHLSQSSDDVVGEGDHSPPGTEISSCEAVIFNMWLPGSLCRKKKKWRLSCRSGSGICSFCPHSIGWNSVSWPPVQLQGRLEVQRKCVLRRNIRWVRWTHKCFCHWLISCFVTHRIIVKNTIRLQVSFPIHCNSLWGNLMFPY